MKSLLRAVPLHQVRINKHGYTDKGRYFGVGEKLFQLECENCSSQQQHFRAASREAAETIAFEHLKTCMPGYGPNKLRGMHTKKGVVK